jgi:hypothetical protein
MNWLSEQPASDCSSEPPDLAVRAPGVVCDCDPCMCCEGISSPANEWLDPWCACGEGADAVGSSAQEAAHNSRAIGDAPITTASTRGMRRRVIQFIR